jgi:nucleoside 2-deoxyribosyltransferase|tara:strand:+ start:8182 stop:8613 length:432 start_codon:yes stop_codon:yes gene_type:complete
MKIYFAGSITGGRDDLPIYKQIAKYLEKHGEILTPHVYDGVEIKDWIPLNADGSPITNESVFVKDKGLLDRADVFIAEITKPSLGVGYEIGMAEAMGIPMLLLYRKGEKRVSAMVLGNKKFNSKEYMDVEETEGMIGEFFGSL